MKVGNNLKSMQFGEVSKLVFDVLMFPVSLTTIIIMDRLKNVVVVGATGNGKSAFCNRLSGS